MPPAGVAAYPHWQGRAPRVPRLWELWDAAPMCLHDNSAQAEWRVPGCDWLVSSVILWIYISTTLIKMLLNTALKLPVIYHILEGFRKIAWLHWEHLRLFFWWFFFFLTNKVLFSSWDNVCLPETMCGNHVWFFFYFETVAAKNTQNEKWKI